MSDIVIKAENIGKLYKLGEIGTGTISHDLNRWLARMRGKEDPFAKVGETNDRTAKGLSDWVWALKDINFEVKQGEVLGIIGRNGAGKSTLLKILSKVTTPSSGRIKVKGRIASLLEVGTGFHQELTGRENIFLNGAILGMTKAEIRSKFDEIVDFSGVERYIDTPVKRYSSGMHVRLAFAVAAFLEPEILIIDEVLAVGDAEFQKKCLGRMKDVSVNDGRTVLFVSHNIPAIQVLCTKGIVLEKGTMILNGKIEDAVSQYLANNNTNLNRWVVDKKKNTEVYFTKIETQVVEKQPRLVLKIKTWLEVNSDFPKSYLSFYIGSIDAVSLMEAIPIYKPFIEFTGKGSEVCISTEIYLPPMIPGLYTLGVWLGSDHSHTLDWQKEAISFEIIDSPMENRTIDFPKHAGFVFANSQMTGIEYLKT